MNKQCILKRDVIALIFTADVSNETIMIDSIAHC